MLNVYSRTTILTPAPYLENFCPSRRRPPCLPVRGRAGSRARHCGRRDHLTMAAAERLRGQRDSGLTGSRLTHARLCPS
ncbi:hypothetical protein NDU88_001351 [Pleurodeles waltl]|uniref:Uncharacterized protein n=1 Tax=Pleurodeles waltl TaxID=8319 RepID=A0AAV7KW31_PLEWA|nr:hypothetical protein NDU88_001351 [Pleurodeles waltl]